MIINNTVFIVMFWFLLCLTGALAKTSVYRYFRMGYSTFISFLKVFGFIVVLVLFVHYCFIGQYSELVDSNVASVTTHTIKEVKPSKNGEKLVLHDRTITVDDYVKDDGVDAVTMDNIVEETVYHGIREWLFFDISALESKYVVK